MQPMTCFKLTFAACVCAAMVGCGNDGSTDADKGKTAAAPAKTAEVVIYTNADEEAQTAMKNALDKNGMKGAYLIQSFGTSELGGKLAAEGKNIEADVVTLSTYYLDSFQKKEKLLVLPICKTRQRQFSRLRPTGRRFWVTRVRFSSTPKF